MKKIIVATFSALILTLTSCAPTMAKADLALEAQFDLTGKNFDKAFLTVQGTGESVLKDSVDVATGASKMKGTEVLNSYRSDAEKKSLLPGGIQSLVKYGVSSETSYLQDRPNASKAADGVITVQYLHRGRAYKMISDAKGQFTVPSGNYVSRVIASLQPDGFNLIAPEYSATGKVEDLDWAKVWDSSIPAGTLIEARTADDGKITEFKTSGVVADVPTSAKPYAGTFQVTLEGSFLTIKGDLNLTK